RYFDGFVEAVGLSSVTLVLHGEGALVGLDYARRHERNVRGIVLVEPVLRPLTYDDCPAEFVDDLKAFRDPERASDLLVNRNCAIEQLLRRSVVRPLLEDELNHYREPFRDASTRRAIMALMGSVPIDGQPADGARACAA